MAGRKRKEETLRLKAEARPLILQGVSYAEIARRLGVDEKTIGRYARELEKELAINQYQAEADAVKKIFADLELTRQRLNTELSKDDADSLLIQRLTEREDALRNQLLSLQNQTSRVDHHEFLHIADGDEEVANDILQQMGDVLAGLTIKNLRKLLELPHWAKYLKQCQ